MEGQGGSMEGQGDNMEGQGGSMEGKEVAAEEGRRGYAHVRYFHTGASYVTSHQINITNIHKLEHTPLVATEKST